MENAVSSTVFSVFRSYILYKMRICPCWEVCYLFQSGIRFYFVYCMYIISYLYHLLITTSEASPTDLSVDLRIFEQNYGPTDKWQKPTDKIGCPDS